MDVVEIFSKGDYEINVRLTKDKDDMIAAAGNADEYDIVVCCGGDGTLNIVAGAIYENYVGGRRMGLCVTRKISCFVCLR
jgi:diacylglycerol kinase family enzyme